MVHGAHASMGMKYACDWDWVDPFHLKHCNLNHITSLTNAWERLRVISWSDVKTKDWSLRYCIKPWCIFTCMRVRNWLGGIVAFQDGLLP